MKKYLMTGIAALAMCAGFTSCSHDLEAPSQEEINEVNAQKVTETYNRAFIAKFGQPAADQDWGFGTASNARALTRSQHSPTVYSISAPYDEAWVANYLTTAKEPDNQNTGHNYDNSSYARKDGTYGEPYSTWYSEFEASYPTANYGWDWNKAVAAAKAAGWEHFDDLFTYNPDENFVLNFKITGTYGGYINVAASEGITDGGTLSGAERTIVVTGTWNITEDQRIGSLGKIIIANGGTVNVASGKTLNMVNQAQLVVLEGGTLTGAGKVEVNNGNEAGRENYNAGTFSVATFNNNFGQFYNYGDFNVNEYQGGAQKSNFFNHATAVVDHFSSTANARIYNNCSFVVTHDARIRNYEGSTGSSLVVGGELLFSSSEDGTGDATYVGLANGALVKCATLYNQGTSWSGPSSGNAALEITDKITYLNWQQDAPQTGGYFEGNILVRAGTWDNIPDGNGYQAGETATADYKFWNIVANCTSNKGVKKVSAGNTVAIASSNCTPGFTYGDPDPDPDPEYETRIIGEDLTPGDTDWDFNDVVFAVEFSGTTANCTLLAAGGTLPLRIYTVANEQNPEQNFVEVHELFGVNTNVMVNTGGISTTVDKKPTFSVTGVDSSKRGKDIIIRVNKGTSDKPNWVELKAEKGDPAAKLAVSKNFKVCTERQNINTVYTRFSDWVADKGVIWY